MASRSQFWVHLHGLMLALEFEGGSEEERRRNLSASFYAMPPTTRAELQRALETAVTELPEVDATIRLGPPN